MTDSSGHLFPPQRKRNTKPRPIRETGRKQCHELPACQAVLIFQALWMFTAGSKKISYPPATKKDCISHWVLHPTSFFTAVDRGEQTCHGVVFGSPSVFNCSCRAVQPDSHGNYSILHFDMRKPLSQPILLPKIGAGIQCKQNKTITPTIHHAVILAVQFVISAVTALHHRGALSAPLKIPAEQPYVAGFLLGNVSWTT